MFSNRSVSVQPSAPPIEYAGRPDAWIVSPLSRNVSQSSAGLTPASLYALTLYQTVDLLAALMIRPYRLPLISPSFSMSAG